MMHLPLVEHHHSCSCIFRVLKNDLTRLEIPDLELIMQRVDSHHNDENERIQAHAIPYFLDA